MATLREIKRRIVGVKSTQQITRAMKMVAAARLRRAQENIINARPYSRKIAGMLGHLLRIEKNVDLPLLEVRPAGKIAVLVLTSDRGLCGGFNMNVIKKIEDLVENDFKDQFNSGKVFFYFIGKKGHDYFKNKNLNIAGAFPGIFSRLEFSFASSLVEEVSAKFTAGEYDRVFILYNQFKSVIQHNLVIEQLLPLEAEKLSDEDIKFTADYIFEPDELQIIKKLIPRHLKAQVWRSLLDSYAAELGARMTAMDMATENATELIHSLRLTFNKARQAAITKEILEIVSGANALKKG